MNKEEFDKKLKEIDIEYQLNKKEVIKEFCNANNPYKIGDKFTDHIGSIIIERIGYLYSLTSIPSCSYTGIELKKDGTPKKGNIKRRAYQCNDIINQ